jgi:hypothetical protein
LSSRLNEKGAKPRVQRKRLHLPPREPTSCIALVDAIRGEHGAYIWRDNVELPVAPTILNGDAPCLVGRECPHLFFGLTARRHFGSLTLLDRPLRGCPTVHLRPPTAIAAGEGTVDHHLRQEGTGHRGRHPQAEPQWTWSALQIDHRSIARWYGKAEPPETWSREGVAQYALVGSAGLSQAQWTNDLITWLQGDGARLDRPDQGRWLLRN